MTWSGKLMRRLIKTAELGDQDGDASALRNLWAPEAIRTRRSDDRATGMSRGIVVLLPPPSLKRHDEPLAGNRRYDGSNLASA